MLKTITCGDALADLTQFDTIVDVRSQSEYVIDHLPGAINCPVLTDAQRSEIGVLYRSSPFEARRAGAALVSANIALHLREVFAQRPRTWAPLVYCWRGGERSASMAYVMSRVGWPVRQLEGGYRAFRRSVIDALQTLPERFRFRVLSGATGTGKSRLLVYLQRAGSQVLDLEALASHRGSVLGSLPDHSQPGQKCFETRLWCTLRSLDPARPVFVESESRRIGQCQLPGALLDAIRASECVRLELPLPQRVRLLRDDYRHFEQSPDALLQRLAGLSELHGKAAVERWQRMVLDKQWDALVHALLAEHYDPVYTRSIRNNFPGDACAVRLALHSADAADFEAAARELAG